MRLRSRELNVFSMSALDLFASGMGAFILVTVMALPFFPNTGDSGEDIKVVQAALDDERRQREDAERQLSDAKRRLTEAQRQRDRALRDLERADQTSPVPDDDAAERAEAARRSLEEAEKRLQAAEDRLAESQRQLEDARRQLQDAEKNAEDLGKALADMQFPDMDIVICLDVSGSMREEIEGLKREITDLANVLDNLAPSTGIGVVAFGDRRWRNPIHVQEIVGLSRLSVLERFVQGLEPNMNDPRAQRNQDRPEAIATALDRAVRLNWRSVSRRRYIVVVSDAPAYPDREQSALRTAQSFASVTGQTVSGVVVPFPDTSPERFMRALAAAGNGSLIDATRGESMMASLLLVILKS